ncbi:myocardin-related transcription factor B [Cyprinodon tularosa]|uniref:myocardin-related transcription factor B n=1 Tax=Cyprinodon tularosa TaxID=77115 RepID=UPI0018E20B48|nr:myocardin-related transcription factor B [Cyprinodon tularosa]
MGLQSWPRRKQDLSSMACLDVESPSICRGKFKSVLQQCLQQRRTREQLVEQGIMPPLKSPVAFHKQIRSLQRARKGNFLKHKLCSRPERSELIRMHILEETPAEPSLQATQIKLKRARLANDLNKKITQRPGSMELVKKILPIDPEVKELINNGKADYSDTPHVPDVYSFDEDSSDALSSQQPDSQPSPPQTLPSPKESRGAEVSNASSDRSPSLQFSQTCCPQPSSDVSTSDKHSSQGAHQPITAAVQSVSAGPVLTKQTLAKLSADKCRSKKSKELKPRVKKLKYHQYIPPDQKQELSEVPMDSYYARLLQQQQQFLQLQILSLQQQKYNSQTAPVTLNMSTNEIQTSCSALVLRGSSPSVPVLFHHTNTKSDQLPANIDEMKVAELKMELKLRSLPVSGTKTDLIERLKLFHENTKTQHVASMESGVTAENSQSESIHLTPPVSLIASKVSKLGIEDIKMTDIPMKSVAEASYDAALHSSPSKETQHEEGPTHPKVNEKDCEKDKRLHEKELQIEELMRKLEQEQKLVEELKMQLEVEKRSQQSDSPPHLSLLVPIQIKEENRSLSNCSVACSSPGLHVQIKQEEPCDHGYRTSPNQFVIGHETNTKAENLQSVQVLLPTSLSGSADTVEVPAKGIKLHTAVNNTAPGCIQGSGHEPQKSAAPQQQPSTHTPHLTETWGTDTKGQGFLSAFLMSGCESPSSHQVPQEGLKTKQTAFTNHTSKPKDPPRYEDAVKQRRSMITTAQGPTAACQQMDDLFDVLIESGEISPLIRQDPSSLEKPLPVTASVTALPINTVLTRPPPLVQVAQLPGVPLLSPGNNLETLADDTEVRSLKLMEDLNSPLVHMELNFSESMPPSGVNLQNTSVDSMDWLDLTLSVPDDGINPLDMSVHGAVFSSDFLDSHLNWD